MDPTPEQIAAEPMLKWFAWTHLQPGALQEASRVFCDAAQYVTTKFPRNPERTVCLRKLLEAKDAGVRCNLP